MKTRINKRNVYLDPTKLRKLRLAKGWSENRIKDDLQEEQDPIDVDDEPWTLARNTIDKMFRGEGVLPDVAYRLVHYLGGKLLETLAPIDPAYEPPDAIEKGVDWEWQRDELLHPGVLASNGLHYFVYRMRHRFTPGRFGRGKFYHLGGLAAEEREHKREQLQRHSAVCHRIGQHSNVGENLSSTPVIGDEGWWVVDRWFASTPLSDLLNEPCRIPRKSIPRLMREIADGIEVLHSANVVMRELSPSRVLIDDTDGHAVLTDFELARLLDGAPSLQCDWHEDEDGRYRAPEVQGGYIATPDLYQRADLYSWASILVHVVTGTLPEPAARQDVLSKRGLPKRVRSIAEICLSESPQNRPAGIQAVKQAIQGWE